MLVSFASEPASPNRPNEDLIAATPEVLVLLDGAGAPSGIDTGCRHSVDWYVRKLGPALLYEAQLEQPLSDALSAAISHVSTLHRGSCDLGPSGGPSSTALVVRIRDQEIQYLVLADSTLLILYTHGGIESITDAREAAVGRAHRSAMDETRNGTGEHDIALANYIRAMRLVRNRPGGFWVASSDPAAASESITGSIPLDSVLALALLSDGATRMVDRFRLLSWNNLLSTVMGPDGPSTLISQTRQAEASDPDGTRWPRGKAIDDASVVLADLSLKNNRHRRPGRGN